MSSPGCMHSKAKSEFIATAEEQPKQTMLELSREVEGIKSMLPVQWITDTFASHEKCHQNLERQISAVREASASGASILVQLRDTVHAQLEGLLKQVARLEQDLAATKLELAEVVTDQATNEGELKTEVDSLRSAVDTDIQELGGHFREVQESLREVLEHKVAESRQATERDCSGLRQFLDGRVTQAEERAVQKAEALRDAVAQRLEDRLEEGKNLTMDLFSKIDKVMQDQLDNLRRKQVGLEAQQESVQRVAEDLRHSVEECSEHTRKFQVLHDKLEPRICILEDSQRDAETAREQLQLQLRDALTSRHGPLTLPTDTQVVCQERPGAFAAADGGGGGDSGSRRVSGGGLSRVSGGGLSQFGSVEAAACTLAAVDNASTSCAWSPEPPQAPTSTGSVGGIVGGAGLGGSVVVAGGGNVVTTAQALRFPQQGGAASAAPLFVPGGRFWAPMPEGHVHHRRESWEQAQAAARVAQAASVAAAAGSVHRP